MLRRSARQRSFQLAFAALAACVAAVVTTPARSSTDKWWTGYGNGPDNSRYFPSKQITRGNVSRLQVAWTYPHFGTRQRGARNGVIVTASGLLFGAGRDNVIRGWNTDTGAQLWSSRFGGDFIGSPVMYETAGRQYLLVPAASTPPQRTAVDTAGPLGWAAYALPLK